MSGQGDQNEKDIAVLKERIDRLRSEAKREAENYDEKDDETRQRIQDLVNEANKHEQRVDELRKEVNRVGRIVDSVRIVLYILAAILTFRLGDVPKLFMELFK